MIQPWFTDARFGLFIHWGLYAIPGTNEWHLQETGDVEGYLKLPEQFNPVDFDPASWADQAWNAGMRYVVFTTKHHDGFCMYDNPHTDYKITNTPYGKDVTTLVVDAFRARGFRIGLYHSLIDWHHPHYVPDPQHPLGKEDPERQWPERDMRLYAKYLYDSVEHLMLHYGQIDYLFWDYVTDWKKPADFGDVALVEMIKRHQPTIIINDRLADPRQGEVLTPEAMVPNVPPATAWEICVPLNYYWGYRRNSKIHMSAMQVENGLMRCIAQGGNLLVNVGPDELGKLPADSTAVLKELATWFEKNESAVRGCGRTTFTPPAGCVYTTDEQGYLYLYMPVAPLGDVYLPDMKGRCVEATLLREGVKLSLIPSTGEFASKNDLRLKTSGSCRDGDVVRLQLQ